jgi:hypothetical protein
MYEKTVFINCPFDDDYTDLLHAVTFAVLYAGFIPRSALEEVNSGEERLSKIVKLIKDSCLSINDLSRVEAEKKGDLARFNMPFEFGVFYGALALGGKKHRLKKPLVMDSEKYRFQKSLSDIAGKDPACHDNDPLKAISCVRNFLDGKDGGVALPGAAHFAEEYNKFQTELPTLLSASKLTSDEIRKPEYWKAYVRAVKFWMDARATDVLH